MPIDKGGECYHRYRCCGDDSGLVEIIKDYKDGLILFLNNYVKDLTVAEDLAEDTFVLLGTKKPRDKHKGLFKTWLYTIGRNIAIDYLRKESKNKGNKCLEEYENTTDIQDIEKEYIKKERDYIIHTSLKKIKPEYRQVLWLIYFEDMSYKDCARVMKKSVHSVETLAYRARAALKSVLEQEGLGGENI